MVARPESGEYADYYHQYVSKVPDGDIFDILETQITETERTLGAVSDAAAAYRYAPDKWSVKEVIGHLCDIERLFQYRALVFARADKTPLPGMEQDEWVEGANFDERTLKSLIDEYRTIRASTLAMFRSFSDKTFVSAGVASDREFTVRAILYIIAGHEIHHLGVIKDRYLGQSN